MFVPSLKHGLGTHLHPGRDNIFCYFGRDTIAKRGLKVGDIICSAWPDDLQQRYTAKIIELADDKPFEAKVKFSNGTACWMNSVYIAKM